MLYEALRQRYGAHIANRIRHELNRAEFEQAPGGNLHAYLKERAGKKQQEYQALVSNPLISGNVRCEILRERWRAAEDLAYLISIAEDVSAAVRLSIAKGG